MLHQCMSQLGIPGSWADNVGSLFTLITPSLVSADGWKHKGASVCLRSELYQKQSRMRRPSDPSDKTHQRGTASLRPLQLHPEVGQECEGD